MLNVIGGAEHLNDLINRAMSMYPVRSNLPQDCYESIHSLAAIDENFADEFDPEKVIFTNTEKHEKLKNEDILEFVNDWWSVNGNGFIEDAQEIAYVRAILEWFAENP